MPRLAPYLLRHAKRKHPFLPLLLRECRDLHSAQNELRWLKEYAIGLQPDSYAESKLCHNEATAPPRQWRSILRDFVRRRARGEPLQYILGTQPFGNLDILCREDVLIPRPETETYTSNLAALIGNIREAEGGGGKQELGILDLCTGTGCISLLLHSLLKPAELNSIADGDVETKTKILGIDVSPKALSLAKSNLWHNIKLNYVHSSAEQDISFLQADLFGIDNAAQVSKTADDASQLSLHIVRKASDAILPSVLKVLHNMPESEFDVLIANPPYISPRQFSPGGTTSRSVRRWEPQLALVPRLRPHEAVGETTGREPSIGECASDANVRGDEFYAPLFKLAQIICAKVIILEVGDNDQAFRVRQTARTMFAPTDNVVIEVWRDDGLVEEADSDLGRGGVESECRAVVVWRYDWALWRMKTPTQHLAP